LRLDAVSAVELMYAAKGSRQAHFIAVGDAIVDKTVRVARVDRRLSLGDGTFLRCNSVETELGGSPTVARALAAIGRTTMVIPAYNRGEEAASLSQLLDADPSLRAVETIRIDCQDCVVPSVTRYIEQDYLRRDHQIFRVEERSDRIPEIDAAAVILGRRPNMKGAIVVLSDYGRGFVTETLCSAVSDAAAGKLILDPAGQWSHYRRLGDIEVLLLRGDQLADLCRYEGIDVDPVSALDRRAGVLFVLSRWPQLGNVVVKDHGTADTALFRKRVETGRMLVDVLGFRKSDQALKTRLGGGTAFAAYLSAGIGVGLDVMDAALVGETGALTMSLLDRPGVPSIEEIYRSRKEAAALFSICDEGTEELDSVAPQRDFL
jgi:hypothetical protein